MGSLENAIKKLAEFKTDKSFKDIYEEEPFDETILESDKEDSQWEDEDFDLDDFEITETPVPSGEEAFFKEEESDIDFDALSEASKKSKNLLKMALKLEKLGASDSFDDEKYEDDEEWDDNYMETAVTPNEIDAWDDDEIPDEYKMQQLSDEDIGSIFGLEGEDAFVEDPMTGKKHYDVESDISLFDEDFEEKSTEAPTEVEDFIRQMEKELENPENL